jgi:CRISPR-associated protein Cmr4
MEKAIIVGFLAETELHPGAGQGLGTIDQPVQREGGTGFPVIPGTSYKGAAKGEITNGVDNHDLIDIFGRGDPTTTRSGTVAFGDIRLLLLPMRCSHTAYKWVTTPHLLERFARDAERAIGAKALTAAAPSEGQVLTDMPAGSSIYIEEFMFKTAPLPANGPDIVRSIANLVPSASPYDSVRARLGQQLLIMHDNDFSWFCQYGLPVRAHNQLNPQTKASKQLWYEEYLPVDTLLYAINTPRSSVSQDLSLYRDQIGERKWLQVGGNETTGEGVCRVHVWQQ